MSDHSGIKQDRRAKTSKMEVHQDTRGRSRYPHPEEPRETYHGDPEKAGTKRLFSNRESRISDRESEHGEICEAEEDEENQHSGKRHRASDWPLTSTNNDSPQSRAPLRNRNAPNSPSSYRRPSSSQARPSKFLEGSMNDRISNKPPTTYIGDEEFLERYERGNADMRGRKIARPKTFTHHPNASTVGSEVSRHSGIFRFGKSLAASFNPSNWKIFSKPQEEVEDAQQKILRERRDKAEAMYQELKKTGQFRESNFGTSLFQHPEEKVPVPAKHDSGVEFGHRRSTSRVRSTSHMSNETSREDKRNGRVFLEPPQLPTGNESHFSQSPASTTQESVRTAKFHFKKPSLSNIRKSISDIASDASTAGEHHHQARRVPSRKDLQKHQKLVKRVSDLEGKLEAARRQLAQAMDEPVPSGPPRVVRQRFVPGAMPSLPSERLLFAGYGSSDAGMSESVSISQIGKAVTMDEPANDGARYGSEQPNLDEPTRLAPPPPDFDKSLPQEPDTPPHDRVMQSVEVEEEESLEMDEHSAEAERLVVQSVKSRQAQVVQQAAASNISNDRSDLTSLEADSDYEVSESGKHETSPEPSEGSELNPAKEIYKSKPQSSKPQASKSKKRKSLADDSGVFKPTTESGSDISFVKPKRTPKNGSNPPRKLQKTSSTSTKPSPRCQVTPGKKSVIMPSKQKSKFPVKGQGRQSVSPPPSGQFTGLEYVKPGRSGGGNGAETGEATMAAYSAIPSADGDEVPPMPKMPKAVRLASGEVVEIPAQTVVAGVNGGGKLHREGSKLTKSRPTPSPKKREERKGKSPKKGEDFEWPEDVF